MDEFTLPLPEEKPHYVKRMFAAISRRYDLMNRIMSLGLDRSWRRTVVELCDLPARGRVLDVATGTGDIAIEIRRMYPQTQVVGVDLTHAMLDVGRQKAPSGIRFVQGDALSLPFADGTFDAVCSGFLMRNVKDIVQAFAEQRRVVRPGGRVVCLEITHPRSQVWRYVFRMYFLHVVPVLGGVIGGDRDAYTYLPRSTLVFPDPDGLAEIMRQVGLRNVRYHIPIPGTVAIHVGEVW